MLVFNNNTPKIYQIADEGDWYQVNYFLETISSPIISLPVETEKIPFYEIDPTTFDFVEGEDEAEFQHNSRQIEALLLNYEQKETPMFPSLSSSVVSIKKVIPKGRLTIK